MRPGWKYTQNKAAFFVLGRPLAQPQESPKDLEVDNNDLLVHSLPNLKNV